MDPKNLIGINPKINNVYEATLPYWWAFQGVAATTEKTTDKKMVVFFGNDMATFTKMGVDANRYIKKCNECLNYLRKNFKNCRLCFKPHPADKEERVLLDLTGFDFIKDEINSELFLFQNRNRIKGVFSQGSASSWSAYGMGLSAHVFYKCFVDICGDDLTRPPDDFFFDMPQSFFIKDFNEKITSNAQNLEKAEPLELFFKQKLSENTGTVWLVAFTVEYIVILIALSKLVRNYAPARKIGLIISHHRYWSSLNADYFKEYFDEIVVWPRISYSLRPVKLWQAMTIARQIKNFRISKGDILVSIAQNSFVENCLNSYHKNNLKIGLIANKDFNLFYNSRNSVYANNDDFRFNKASWFFNKIFEPLLGLHRSLFMFYGRGGGSFITRYQKPLNEVFDEVIILKSSA